jgi:hypothetical protein
MKYSNTLTQTSAKILALSQVKQEEQEEYDNGIFSVSNESCCPAK